MKECSLRYKKYATYEQAIVVGKEYEVVIDTVLERAVEGGLVLLLHRDKDIVFDLKHFIEKVVEVTQFIKENRFWVVDELRKPEFPIEAFVANIVKKHVVTNPIRIGNRGKISGIKQLRPYQLIQSAVIITDKVENDIPTRILSYLLCSVFNYFIENIVVDENANLASRTLISLYFEDIQVIFEA